MSATPVYRRAGRGGAGNYFPQSQCPTSKSTVDLEAQTSSATPSSSQISSNAPTSTPSLSSSSSSSSTTATTSTIFQSPTDPAIDVSTGTIVDRKYQTAGRGGAGNWYDTSLTSSNGSNNNTNNTSDSGADPHTNSTTHAEYKQTRTYGRGGTGNWEASEQLRLKQEKEEREVEMKVMSSDGISEDPVIALPDVAHVRVPLQGVEVERLDV